MLQLCSNLDETRGRRHRFSEALGRVDGEIGRGATPRRGFAGSSGEPRDLSNGCGEGFGRTGCRACEPERLFHGLFRSGDSGLYRSAECLGFGCRCLGHSGRLRRLGCLLGRGERGEQLCHLGDGQICLAERSSDLLDGFPADLGDCFVSERGASVALCPTPLGELARRIPCLCEGVGLALGLLGASCLLGLQRRGKLGQQVVERKEVGIRATVELG